MRLKIAQKILILFLSLIILSTTAVFIIGYLVSSRALSSKVEDELKLSLKRSSEEVNNFLQDQMYEAKAIAEFPLLKDIFNSLNSRNYSDFVKKRELLEKFFLKYQENRQAIQAIRVVDTEGKVLIKVKELNIIDKNKQHPHLPITMVGSLSEKGFFSEMIGIGMGQVWMSNFELGVDNNQFCPPLIRLATPISLNKRVAGLLIVNIWGKRIGEIVNNTIRKEDGYSFITEKNLLNPERHGIYLNHPEGDVCFLNQTKKGRNFFIDYPDAERLIDKRAEGIIHNSSKDLLVFLYYSPYRLQERGWLMVTLASRDRVLAPIIKQRKVMLIVGVITILASAMIVVLLSKTLTKPINLLSKGAMKIGAGDLDYRITASSRDEIGDLAREFNSMSVALKENINKRVEAEARAYQAEKLASIGELASGVAHEINNPLGNIISTSRLLRDGIGSINIDDIKADIDTIIKEGRRCERIITGLLNFSRETPLYKTHEDISTLIDEVVVSLNNKIQDKRIVIHKEYTRGLPEIYVDRAQIQQIFSNVILNSIHATGEGGNIKIGIERRGDDIEVEISDTGAGIPLENMKKLFNPFFTTKAVGEGVGLGLAISYGIVKRHRGEIIIESEVGKGTRCVVILPVNGADDV